MQVIEEEESMVQQQNAMELAAVDIEEEGTMGSAQVEESMEEGRRIESEENDSAKREEQNINIEDQQELRVYHEGAADQNLEETHDFP